MQSGYTPRLACNAVTVIQETTEVVLTGSVFFKLQSVTLCQWDLLCGRSSYPHLSQSAFFLGLMIGAWLFGSLSDVYGRKKIAFLALLGAICTGLGYSLASSFLVFALFRLLFGLSKQGFIVAAFTLMVEVVGASKRTFVTIVNQAMFTAGICALPLLSYYIRSWRTLSITISLLGIGFLSVWK